MSQIHNINDTNNPIPVSGTGNIKNTDSASFKNALNNAMDQDTHIKHQSDAAKSLSEISSLSSVKIADVSENVSTGTNELLNLLELYTSKLENPAVTLKNMEPMLEQLNQNAEALLTKTQFLDQSDAPLREIATQTAVTAQTEYVKFQRGDYLS